MACMPDTGAAFDEGELTITDVNDGSPSSKPDAEQALLSALLGSVAFARVQ